MGSLFNLAELQSKIVDVSKSETATMENANGIAFEGKDLKDLSEILSIIIEDWCIWYKTDGAWSNYQLLETVLKHTGPAKVWLATWAMSDSALSAFSRMKNSGQIIELNAVVDNGLRNRKPEVFQRMYQVIDRIKIAHCHAKSTVIWNDNYQITIIGSANYTKNPRKEVGIILFDKTIAQANRHWLESEIATS